MTTKPGHVVLLIILALPVSQFVTEFHQEVETHHSASSHDHVTEPRNRLVKHGIDHRVEKGSSQQTGSPTPDDPLHSEFLHQVTHGEPFPYILLCVEFPTRVEGHPSPGNDPGGQRNVGSNHQVP